jgi:Family of unknown function (DUF6491)
MALSRPAGTLMLACLAASCASLEGDGAGTRTDCFQIRQVSGYDVIDDRHLFIQGSSKKDRFLLTMLTHCPGVRSAQSLALSNELSRLCADDFGSVTYRDFGQPRKCRIDNIERVGSKEEAKETVAIRSKKKGSDP